MDKWPGPPRDCSLALPQIRTCPIKAYGSSRCGLTCAVLPVAVTVTRVRGSRSSAWCPTTAPQQGAPFRPRGARAGVSQVQPYYGALRRPASLSPRSVAFTWRYHTLRLSFRSRRSRTPNRGPGVQHPVPPAGLLRMETIQDLPGSWRTLLSLRPVLRPRQDRTHQATTVHRHGPRYVHNEGSHDNPSFGAQSHGLGDSLFTLRPVRCRTRRKTRFRLLAKLSRTGLVTRRVPPKGFKGASYISSPFPKLAWRKDIQGLYQYKPCM